jgi:hypothetical protein
MSGSETTEIGLLVKSYEWMGLNPKRGNEMKISHKEYTTAKMRVWRRGSVPPPHDVEQGPVGVTAHR